MLILFQHRRQPVSNPSNFDVFCRGYCRVDIADKHAKQKNGSAVPSSDKTVQISVGTNRSLFIKHVHTHTHTTIRSPDSIVFAAPHTHTMTAESQRSQCWPHTPDSWTKTGRACSTIAPPGWAIRRRFCPHRNADDVRCCGRPRRTTAFWRPLRIGGDGVGVIPLRRMPRTKNTLTHSRHERTPCHLCLIRYTAQFFVSSLCVFVCWSRRVRTFGGIQTASAQMFK